MTSRFHPWMSQVWLTGANRVRDARRAWPQTLFLGAIWIALAASALWVLQRIDGDRIGVVLHLLLQQPLILPAAFAALGFVGVHGATHALATEWRHGWWGAVPVDARVARRSLRVMAVLFVVAFLIATILVFGVIATSAEHWRTWFAAVTATAAIGVPIGGALGYYSARRNDTPQTSKRRHMTPVRPLVRMAWLDHPRLPGLADWQRRDTARRWRSGGSWWPFLALGIAVPANEAAASLVGLLVLGLVLIWLGLAARATAEVIERADALLVATPLTFRRFAAGTARYPLWTLAIGSLSIAAALRLQDAPWVVSAVTPLALAVPMSLQLATSWRYRARPARAAVRFGVDLALVAAAAMAAGPLALPLWAAIVARHFHLSTQRR